MWRRVALAAAVAILAVRLIWFFVIPAWQTIVTDFPNYYVSAWAVRHGEPLGRLYDPIWFERAKLRAGIERPASLFNYFPPMNALIMWPLAHLPPLTAKGAWTIVNIIALIAVIHLTSTAAGLKWPQAVLIALLGGDALGNNFTFGQFYIVLTLLLLCGVVWSKKHPSIAGLAAAAGAATKIFPGFLLVYFAIRREKTVLLWSAAGMIVFVILGLALMGLTPHHTYLTEVFGRTLRGEIQDPYNIHWNTLQAFLRRALVHDDLLNPHPILNAPWLFFFLRPLLSIAVAAATVYAIARARTENALVSFGALIAMVSLITPSQASYHYFLFYPAVAGLRKFVPAALFALMCSNVMGMTAGFDSGIAMLFAFPRAWLVIVFWIIFLKSLDPPPTRVSIPGMALVIVVIAASAYFENRRWIADVSDGAIRVDRPISAALEVYPRFVDGRLVTSVLGPDGFGDSLPETDNPTSTSPDGAWTAYATSERGNWDIAVRSNRTGERQYLTSSSANDITPAFSPDGRWIYFASDRHRGYRFTTIYRLVAP